MPANSRPGWKCLRATNALAYYDTGLIMASNSFIELATWPIYLVKVGQTTFFTKFQLSSLLVATALDKLAQLSNENIFSG